MDELQRIELRIIRFEHSKFEAWTTESGNYDPDHHKSILTYEWGKNTQISNTQSTCRFVGNNKIKEIFIVACNTDEVYLLNLVDF